jgi:hypothetical protein
MTAAAATSGTDTPAPRFTRNVPVGSMVSRSSIPGGFDRPTDELPPSERVLVTVESHVTLDSRTGMYTYSYRLTNDPTSLNDIDSFALGPVASPDTVDGPEHWSAFLYPFQDSSEAVRWVVTDVGALPSGYVDTGNIPPSEFDLPPGRTVEGFRFQTRSRPRREPVQFFASGFDTLPAGGESLGDDDPQPDVFQRSVTGYTLGPDRRRQSEHLR